MKVGSIMLIAILVVSTGAIWLFYHLLAGPALLYDFRNSHLDRDVNWPGDRNTATWEISRVHSVSVNLPGVRSINRSDVSFVYFIRVSGRLSEMGIALTPVNRQKVMRQGREIAALRGWPDPSENYAAWTRFEKTFGPSSTCALPNGLYTVNPPPLNIWAEICPGGGTPGDSYRIEIIIHWTDK